MDAIATVFRGPSQNKLQQKELIVFKEDICKKTFSVYELEFVDKFQLCVGYGEGNETDVSRGDGGAPLMGTFESTSKVIGVGSFSDRGLSVSIFTRVNAYLDWIKNVISTK